MRILGIDRDRLPEIGIALEDSPDGTTWRFK